MRASRTVHRCSSCGAGFARWSGRCTTCGEWNTLVEEAASPRPEAPGPLRGGPAAGGCAPVPLAAVSLEAASPLASGVGELDRVLSGGLVPGSVTLLAGEPGIGKSTLVLQLAAGFAAAGHRVLLVSGEETAAQVRRRAERLGGAPASLDLLATSSLADLLAAVQSAPPQLLVLDSVQTLADERAAGAAGSVSQVASCALALVQLAKTLGTAVVLVGHVTKDGSPAGPRQLEHLVDTVLGFEGDRHHELRLLSVLKHRFGPAGELGVLAMGPSGLVAVDDPSRTLLAERRAGNPGSAVVPLVAGRRAILAEVQCLVAPSALSQPRRAAHGVAASRLAILLAVLEQRLGCSLSGRDVFCSVTGGLRAGEPAADLAVALALVSASSGRPLPEGLVVCGEVGLGGEVRRVGQLERRLGEAARLGFTAAVVPGGQSEAPSPLELRPVASVAEALSLLALAA